jgi:hypothetical protein
LLSGKFEFHAEWLRDEPFDATTTGQNKDVPVSTLSWVASRSREHEIRSTQCIICCPYFFFPKAIHQRKVKATVPPPNGESE